MNENEILVFLCLFFLVIIILLALKTRRLEDELKAVQQRSKALSAAEQLTREAMADIQIVVKDVRDKRKAISNLLDHLDSGRRKQILIIKHNKPAAILMSPTEYEDLYRRAFRKGKTE